MKRRVILGIALGLLVGCSDASPTDPPGPAPDPDPVQPVDPADYLDRPLRDQVDVVEAGLLSCVGLTTGYLDRIAERDDGDDGIGAVLALAPDPSAVAEALADKAGTGARLTCANVLLKDNIDSAGMATTAGSIAMVDNLVDEDAPVARRLRDASALLLGKTNLSEWANFRGVGSTSGWSSLGGQTHNGAAPAYNPCGSSSGSAAAVAAGLASAAIGTETDGSITCPAAVNGVVGFKPTVGLVSRTGIVPISRSQDTAGPITRTVGDAARLLSVMAGPDPADPATAAIPVDLNLDFEASLGSADFDGARIGVITNLVTSAEVVMAFEAELAMLESAGAILVDVTLPTSAAYGQAELTVLTTELKVDLGAYLASHSQPGQPTTLAELIAFNAANAATVMPHFGQELFELAETTSGLDDPAYLAALADSRRITGEEGIDAVMLADDLDLLISPTTGPAWKTDYANGDSITGVAGGPAAVAGYPHLTVPMGTLDVATAEGFDALPLGMSFMAGRWQDSAVLDYGHAYEQLKQADPAGEGGQPDP